MKGRKQTFKAQPMKRKFYNKLPPHAKEFCVTKLFPCPQEVTQKKRVL